MNLKARAARLLKKYGLTVVQYQMILTIQGNTCAICERPQSPYRSLDVDHDHKTGRIRGLLCFLCNKGLGYFRSAEQLLEASRYMDSGHTGYYVPKKRRKKRVA